MERKSWGWMWVGVGVVAVVILLASGVGRRSPMELAPPSVTPPIIVEPIQPNAAQVPVTTMAPAAPSAPVAQAAAPVAVASAPNAPSGPATPLPAAGTERVRKIQQALKAAGYEPGTIDGKMGKMTNKAIRQFQEAQGLSVDGKVGPKTWARLEPFLRTTNASASTNKD